MVNKNARTETEESVENYDNTWKELESIDASLESLDSKLSQEVNELKLKYEGFKAPLYEKRSQLLSIIPRFWSIAFKSHPLLGNLLEDEDLEAFSYLKEISVEYGKNSRKFTFKFDSNPYFRNTELTKEILQHETEFEVINKPIEWCDGMNLCDTSTAMNGQKRKKETTSFFAWFSDEDLEVADLIADDLFPRVVNYFKGLGDGHFDGNDLGDDDDEDDDDDDEEDDEDDEEDDENEGEEDIEGQEDQDEENDTEDEE